MARRQQVQPRPFQRRDGTIGWRVRFRLAPGENPVSETFDDQDEAIAFCRIVNTAGGAAARKARDATGAASTRSADAAFKSYLTHAGTNAHEGTLTKYQRDWDLRIAPTFGAWPIDAITREAVEAWIVDLRKTETVPSKRRRAKDKDATPDYLAPKTIRSAHGLLSAVLKQEVLAGRLSGNPAYGITMPDAAKKRPPVFLTQSEYATLSAHVDPDWQDLVHLIAGTGLRWSEATALRQDDFDLDSPQPSVTVTRAWKRVRTGQPWEIGPPKTAAGTRTISLSRPVVAQMLPRLNQSTPGALLFAGALQERLQGEWFHLRVWKPAIRKSGINRNPMIHDLRHSHASWLIAQGVPLTYIQRRLGHASIQVTSDTYGHLSPDAWRATAEATERAMTLALPQIESEPDRLTPLLLEL